jgi:hypothetical protein
MYPSVMVPFVLKKGGYYRAKFGLSEEVTECCTSFVGVFVAKSTDWTVS